ncbi:MAG: selenium-binding protein SBP56-related protein, partial [Gaiellaceae bacterium]
MKPRTLIWLAALPCAVLAIAVAVAGARPVEALDSTQPSSEHGKKQERYLYVTTIAQSATDPDFIAVIGADSRRADFGKIVNRVDMPNVGDELHHFGYSRDQERLVVPGLFSNRINVFDIGRDRKTMALRAVDDQLAADSGYVVPHGVMDMDGKFLVPMI